MFTQARVRTRSQSLYDELRVQILSGQLSPGFWLREEQIADQFAVSRTPVREALRRLEADGLVHIAPRRGALIAELALEELDEVYDIRVALETLAATRAIGRITPAELAAARAALADGQEAVTRGDMDAAMRANDRFHQIVYGAARSPRLWGLIADLGNVIRRYRHASISRPGRAALVLQQHAQQLAAIESGDRGALQHLVAEHVEGARNSVIRAQIDRARDGRTAAVR